MKPRHPGRISAFAFLAATLSLCGQTAPTAPSAPAMPAKEEVVTLSPFEVSTTQDTGYAGQDTLSGSRLRTNLRD